MNFDYISCVCCVEVVWLRTRDWRPCLNWSSTSVESSSPPTWWGSQLGCTQTHIHVKLILRGFLTCLNKYVLHWVTTFNSISPCFFMLLDLQGYRCREGEPGDKPGRPSGLGDLHASSRPGRSLWCVCQTLRFIYSLAHPPTNTLCNHNFYLEKTPQGQLLTLRVRKWMLHLKRHETH